ncbi:MAG: hypothetical protein K2J95_10780 [Lachnospiraceae bacterium]|nr:hypothetical protein [Lachnospiraceae bacterium]MDE6744351.1 hypothetical protein [Lachnospiraceae bacterium]
MRITNKVMQNNALVNINNNKVAQDMLNTQLATGKKVNRPSEDPIVAIRALRLRSDVDQVTQYLKKNVPDAVSWLELTEGALKTTVSVLKDMIEQCEKGSSDQLKTEDRQVIIDSLNELYKEVYDTGKGDYAGRYIFTGYRTDTSLTFGTQTEKKYVITEAFDRSALEQETFIDIASTSTDLRDLSETTFANGTTPLITENDITKVEYFRFRVAYGNLDEDQTDLNNEVMNGAPVDPDDPSAGSVSQIAINKLDADGNIATTQYAEIMTDPAEAYEYIAANPDALVMVPSTGELLMGTNIYQEMQKSDDTYTITYTKTNWKSTDLRPQHYFKVDTMDTLEDAEGNPLMIHYNPDYPQNRTIGQPIEYQVGFNQSIQVNTYAEDVYKHGIGRDVMEITDLANKLTDIENMKAKLKGMSEDTKYSEDERKAIALDLEAAEKAETFTKDQLQKKFSHFITKMQGYQHDADEARTVVGNRSARLALINNRLTDQKETFDNLKSDNEDADETEVAVNLSSAEVSYEAALMATSSMIKTTLLNYL